MIINIKIIDKYFQKKYNKTIMIITIKINIKNKIFYNKIKDQNLQKKIKN
jgi:hypothetical protein